MICPFCKHDADKVTDSRTSGTSVRRRRECLSCHRRFTTYEYIVEVPLTIIKRDKRSEPYQRDKLLRGITISCTKRPVSREIIEAIVDRVENFLYAMGKEEVSYEVVGNLVMKELASIDQVAYVRFASVYRQFKEVGEFVQQVRSIEHPKKSEK